MKKYLVTLCGIFGVATVHAQNTINISAGTTVVTSGTVSVVANANDFVNNGTYIDNTGTFLVASGVAFSGSGTTTLFNFNVNNTGVTSLSSPVFVQNTAALTSGTLTAGSNELYIRTDLYPTQANLVVGGSLTGIVKGLITNAIVTIGPCPVSSTLSTNVSGSAALYQWQSSPDNSTWSDISGATSAIYAATVRATAYYRCNLITNNSVFNEATSSQLITATGIPIVSGGQNTAIYTGGSTTLMASGANAYSWSPATSLSATTGANVTANPIANTIYTVTGTNVCSAMAEVSVSVNTVPILSNSTVCTGSTLSVVSAAQPTQIIWQQGGISTVTVTPTWAADGITVAGGNGAGSDPNQLDLPYNVCLDRNGNIYVTDYFNNRIQKWAQGATEGITVAGGNGFGDAANQFASPLGAYVDASGNIYVADFGNDRVQKWTPGATEGVSVAGGNGNGDDANQLNRPGRVFVDGHGNIYVADVNNDRVQKWAPGATEGVTVAGTGDHGAAPNQLKGPSDVYVDSSGNIYIADLGNNRIQKWAPDATEGITVAGGNGGGSDPNQLDQPASVYVDGHGNIFVADQNNHRIQEWTPGATAGLTVAGGNGRGSDANQLALPADVHLDGSGNMYVTDYANSRIQEFAASITNTLSATTAGSYNALVTTEAGTIATNTITINAFPIISAGLNNAIYTGGSTVLTATVAATYNWSPITGLSATTGASVIASPAGNTVYTVTGTTNACSSNAEVSVSVYAPPTISSSAACTGSMLSVVSAAQPTQIIWQQGGIGTVTVTPTWVANALTVAGGNEAGSDANQLDLPSGLFVDLNGNIYVADFANDRVQEWAPGASTGVSVAGGNGSGSAANQLSSPPDVYVDGSGNIYVADYFNCRVQKWLPGATSGITVAGGNGLGSAANQLYYPTGVYVDGDGNIYIADSHNNRIQKWTPGATTGITVAGGNGSGNAANQLFFPKRTYVDGSGNIYAADYNNHRIQKWAPGAASGITVAGGNGAGSAANQLYNPMGIWVDGNGNIYVADMNNNRVQEWAPGAAAGATVAGGNDIGSDANQLFYPSGIYVDGSDNIYVADYNNHRVQEFAAVITNTLTATAAGGYNARVTTVAGTKTTNVVTIDAFPVTINGNTQMCAAGPAIMLSDIASPNGTWSSSNTSVASINAAGVITPGIRGTTSISYATGCGTAAVATATVNALPAPISGNVPLCANGSTTTLTNASTNGTWSSSNHALASVNRVTGVVSSANGSTTGGTVTITYNNGCAPAAQITLTVNALPQIRTFTGGGGYCAGNAGVHAGLTLSDAGISYQLYRHDTTVFGAMMGNGSAIDFGLLDTAGGYHAIATNILTGCTNYLPGITVSINPLPDTFTVTGGGSYCRAGTGMHVGLSGSIPGIDYQLYNSGSPVGAALPGTGDSLDFGSQTIVGPYRVIGTNHTTHCSQLMGNSTIAVDTLPLPADQTLTGGGAYCFGDSATHILLSASEPGTKYVLYWYNNPEDSLTGTGTGLDFGRQYAPGPYSVSATDLSTGCSVLMTATVTVIGNPPPISYSMTGGGNYCIGTSGVHVGLAASDPGIHYDLYLGTAATDDSLPGASHPLDFGLITATGTYKVLATDSITGCHVFMNDSEVVTSTPTVTPVVTIATGFGDGDTVCSGIPVTFTAQTTYGGTAPIYHWFLNGTAVGTTDSTFLFSPVSNDVMTVILVSNQVCAITDTVINSMTVNVEVPAPPSVFIVASPAVSIAIGESDTFTAVTANCGSSPQYQWYKNGNLIPGATNMVYTGNGLANHDSISCRVITSGACGGQVTYNSIVISVFSAGVTQVGQITGDIRLIPNPNKGTFIVKGSLSVINDEEVSLEITDMLGQVVYRNKVIARSGVINEQVQLNSTLANGMYMLNLLSATDHKVFHFVIEQ